MRKLENIIILDKETLQKLNKRVDKIAENFNEYHIDCEALHRVLGALIHEQKLQRPTNVPKLIPIKKEELLAVTLDFFKSVDEEFYRKAIDAILNQNERLKMRIYNAHTTPKSKEEDEHEIRVYSESPCISLNKGYASIFIPLQYRTPKKYARKLLKDDEGTLDDLYTIVHEIAHTFDNDEDIIGPPTREEILEGKEHERPYRATRELLAEVSSTGFEFLLTNYLLGKGLYSKSAIIEHEIDSIHSSVDKARVLFAELSLLDIKKKKGEITNDDIEELKKEQKMPVAYIRRMANRIINADKSPVYRNRYAVGGLLAQTLRTCYEENGVEPVKAYLKAARECDFDKALSALGVTQKDEDLKKMVDTVKLRKKDLLEKRGYEIEQPGILL